MQRHRKIINDLYNKNEIRPWKNLAANKLKQLEQNRLLQSQDKETDFDDLLQRDNILFEEDELVDIQKNEISTVILNVEPEQTTVKPAEQDEIKETTVAAQTTVQTLTPVKTSESLTISKVVTKAKKKKTVTTAT